MFLARREPSLPKLDRSGSPVVQRVDSNGIDLISGNSRIAKKKLQLEHPVNGGLAHSLEIMNGLYSDENTGFIVPQAGVYNITIGRLPNNSYQAVPLSPMLCRLVESRL